jgi:ribonucleoside-diphosphate reductase alpha chain
MWKNKDFYNGLSVLPFDGHTYIQAPFTSITKEKYDELVQHLDLLDLTQVVELEDNTSFNESVACGGGSCEIS